MSDNPYIKGFLEIEEARKKGSGNIFAEAKKLDRVGEEDRDINNNGVPSDPSDEYLRRRRAAISKAVEENILPIDELVEIIADYISEEMINEAGWLSRLLGTGDAAGTTAGRTGRTTSDDILDQMQGIVRPREQAQRAADRLGQPLATGPRQGDAGLPRRSAIERAAEILRIPASEVASTLGMGSARPSTATRAMTSALDRAQQTAAETPRPGPTRAAAAGLPPINRGIDATVTPPRAPEVGTGSGVSTPAVDTPLATGATPARLTTPEVSDATIRPTVRAPAPVPASAPRSARPDEIAAMGPGRTSARTNPDASDPRGRNQLPAVRTDPPVPAASTGGPARTRSPAAALAAAGAGAALVSSDRDSGSTNAGETPESPAPERDSWQLTQTLRRGSRGEDVRLLQRALGFSEDQIDGIFGRQTEAAVRRLQQQQGITNDGIVGQETFDTVKNLRSAGSATADSPYTPREVSAPAPLRTGFTRGGR